MRPKILISLFLILNLCLYPGILHALPQGGAVASGSAVFTQPDAQTLDITTSDRVIINYNSFNIASNEAVNFHQPSSSSIALNRVTVDTNPSVILGALTANGQVFIINPNGILFGQGSSVNVHGLLASTMDISNSDFLNSNYSFSQNPSQALGSVINQGSLTANQGGYIVLGAPTVANSGLISAHLGKVVLASSEGFSLTLAGDNFLSFAIEKGVSQDLDTYLYNTGTIAADGGEVLLTAEAAEQAINSVINNSDIIQANTIEEHKGSIKLVSNKTIKNSGTLKSKDVQLQARNVIFKGNFDLFGSVLVDGNLRVAQGQLKANPQADGVSLDISGDLIFEGNKYVWFGKDAPFDVFLKGSLILNNPNAWLYSNINFTGIQDQTFDYSQGTIYGSLEINKQGGRLLTGSGFDLTSQALYFIPNLGQIANPDVLYYIYLGDSLVYFTPEYILYTLILNNPGQDTQSLEAFSLNFLNSNPLVQIIPSLPTGSIYNYFIGNSQHTLLPSYYQITYEDLWPGIDLQYSSRQGSLESEFIVSPNANYQDIRLQYNGIQGLSLDTQGNLLIDTRLTQIREEIPLAYQHIGNTTRQLDAGYTLLPDNTYGFNVGGITPGYTLTIDPLLYSTYLGGSNYEYGNNSLALDAAGNIYVINRTGSADFPTTAGAYDTSYNGNYDVFISKLNSTLSALVYSTYLGGSGNEGTGSDYSRFSLVLDASGNAYVTGFTLSADFPTTPGAYDTSYNGGYDAFIAKLNPTGTALVYSTYLGGSITEVGNSIAVDTSGNAYVIGYTSSANFPTTAGAYDTSYNGSQDVFVTKLNPAGSALVYSTYLGGSNDNDRGYALALDASGNVYVTGYTRSADFPTTVGAYDTSFNGNQDVFIAKLNPTGSALVYSTYLGGSAFDYGWAIAFDAAGNAYVTGYAQFADFPTTAGAYDTSWNGDFDAFIAKLNPTGSALVYCTYLGGTGNDAGYSITLDAAGNAYLAGMTGSADFPTTADAYDTSFNGVFDAFIAKLNPAGSALNYSTYLGGSGIDIAYALALDAVGNAYVTGYTSSADFPTTAGAYDTSFNGGGGDVFILKLSGLVPASTAVSILPEVDFDYLFSRPEQDSTKRNKPCINVRRSGEFAELCSEACRREKERRGNR